MTYRILIAFLAAGLSVASCESPEEPATHSQSTSLSFLGDPPGTTPESLPYPGPIPAELQVSNPVFSPDGTEFYFTDAEGRQIYVMQRDGESWSSPERASFADIGHNYEPFLTHDNRQIYFSSTRSPGDGEYNGRIWRASRQADGSWSEAEMVLDRETEDGFWFANTPDGDTLYFGARLDETVGEGDMYRAVRDGDNWAIENLGAPINSPAEDWDPLVSPDGSYLIFVSAREGGHGETDIYVSFRDGEDWRAPINLGPSINTETYETAATITSDGRYLLFQRDPVGEPISLFWVSTEVISELRR